MRSDRRAVRRLAGGLVAVAAMLCGCTGDEQAPGGEGPAALAFGVGDSVTISEATAEQCADYLARFGIEWQRSGTRPAGSGTVTSLEHDGVRVDVQCSFGTMTVTSSRR